MSPGSVGTAREEEIAKMSYTDEPLDWNRLWRYALLVAQESIGVPMTTCPLLRKTSTGRMFKTIAVEKIQAPPYHCVLRVECDELSRRKLALSVRRTVVHPGME
jgi:hypothetical protein